MSPDGRYVAYTSDQNGRAEVYIVRLPGGTGERQVSLDGVIDSYGVTAWSRKRPVLYFLGHGGTLQSVPVVTSPELRLGKPGPGVRSRQDGLRPRQLPTSFAHPCQA